MAALSRSLVEVGESLDEEELLPVRIWFEWYAFLQYARDVFLIHVQ